MAVAVEMVEYAGKMVPRWTVVAEWHWTELEIGWQVSTHGVVVEVVAHPLTAQVTGESYTPSFWTVHGPAFVTVGTSRTCDCRGADGYGRPWCRYADDVRSSHHVAQVHTVAVDDQTEESGLWPFVKAAGDPWALQIRADLAIARQYADGTIRA